MALPFNFAAHRKQLTDKMDDSEAILIFSSPMRTRNGDADYRYRPDSDLYWLSGWEDPEAALFLRPGENGFVLFCQDKNPEREIWDGFRPGPAGAESTYGADVGYSISELESALPKLIQGVSTLHYQFAKNPDHDALIMGAIKKAERTARKNGLDIPETFHSPSQFIHEHRLIKSDEELDAIREAVRITELAHRHGMAKAQPGLFEYHIESMFQRIFLEQGSTGAGYTPIIAAGTNACTLHYVKNRAELKEGELLLIDAGCESNYYTADITRTFPISGKFSEPQRLVYEVVLNAQLAAIDKVRSGVAYSEIHQTTLLALTQGMVDIGLLEGDVTELIKTEAYKRYYMHGTSHWLGLDVHDVGAYGRNGKVRTLAPGMVLTVEPGLYIPVDDEQAPEAYRGIGIRIEDNVAVTTGDPDVLSANIPKTIEDIEQACVCSQ